MVGPISLDVFFCLQSNLVELFNEIWLVVQHTDHVQLIYYVQSEHNIFIALDGYVLPPVNDFLISLLHSIPANTKHLYNIYTTSANIV